MTFHFFFYTNQQDKEDKENVGEKENGAQNCVGFFDVSEVEITQNHPEKSEQRIDESTEIANLKRQKSQIFIRIKMSCKFEQNIM